MQNKKELITEFSGRIVDVWSINVEGGKIYISAISCNNIGGGTISSVFVPIKEAVCKKK